MKLNKQDKLDIENFAKKIQPIYELLNWKWASDGVPGVKDIKKTIYELVGDGDLDFKSRSTGGITIEIDDDGESEERDLVISFRVEHTKYNIK